MRNNLGQTSFHIAVGTRQSHLGCRMSPLDCLLAPRCDPDVDVADYSELRPIHLAATLSEDRVGQLLNEGADPFAWTIEWHSALHIACLARQSNIVGLLTELYHIERRSKMTDHMDKDGRTALHYTCQSGRIESARILLEVGANPNIKDQKGMTHLDACPEFPEDDYRWHLEPTDGQKTRFTDAAYMTLSDQQRRREADLNRSTGAPLTRDISSEHETVGIRQIIRLLLTHGADIYSKLPESRRYLNEFLVIPLTNTQAGIARGSGCEVVVDELLQEVENAEQDESTNTEEKCGTCYSSPHSRYIYFCVVLEGNIKRSDTTRTLVITQSLKDKSTFY